MLSLKKSLVMTSLIALPFLLCTVACGDGDGDAACEAGEEEEEGEEEGEEEEGEQEGEEALGCEDDADDGDEG